MWVDVEDWDADSVTGSLTSRPGHVKSEHAIAFPSFGGERPSPFKARNAPEFRDYFKVIWEELDVHVAT